MRFVLVASACFVLAAPAAAQMASGAMNSGLSPSERPQPPEEAASQPADGERLICRRIEAGTASRMGSRRVCRTAEQWRATQRD